jgi:hypothetical protein
MIFLSAVRVWCGLNPAVGWRSVEVEVVSSSDGMFLENHVLHHLLEQTIDELFFYFFLKYILRVTMVRKE